MFLNFGTLLNNFLLCLFLTKDQFVCFEFTLTLVTGEFNLVPGGVFVPFGTGIIDLNVGAACSETGRLAGFGLLFLLVRRKALVGFTGI